MHTRQISKLYLFSFIFLITNLAQAQDFNGLKIQLESGNFELAKKTYIEWRKVRSAKLFSENQLEKIGKELHKKGQTNTALEILHFNINFFPNSHDAHAAYAEGLARSGDIKKAIVYFDRANEIKPLRRGVIGLFEILEEEYFERQKFGQEQNSWAYAPFNLFDFWKMTLPKEVSVSSRVLKEHFDQGHAIPQLISLAVAKKGNIIAEHYYKFHPRYRCDLREATFSVASLLTGIALEQKKINSINTPIKQFIPKSFENGVDEKLQGLTFSHLLNMKSGISPTIEEVKNWEEKYFKHRATLKMRSNSWPGKKFEYQKAAAHLLSAALTEATELSLNGFARQNLFHPAIIFEKFWLTDDQNYHFTSHGLYLTLRDMLTLGQIIADEGVFNGKRLLASSWINKIEDVKTSQPAGELFFEKKYGFNLGFWVHNINGLNIILAKGVGGQLIASVPSRDLVVVSVADQEDSRGEREILKLVFEIINDLVQ